jgi:hypothetical protein
VVNSVRRCSGSRTDHPHSFRGEAQILEVDAIDPSVFERLPRGNERDPEVLKNTAIIRVIPRGEFVTFGIAMPITQMRKHEKAHGWAACGTEHEVHAAS